MSKLDDLGTQPGFTEELESVARAVVVAIAGATPSSSNAHGAIDVETSLSALMLVSAGLIASDINLKTPRDLRLQCETFGAMLKDMAKSDRAAAEAGEPTFLGLLGAGVGPGKGSKASN